MSNRIIGRVKEIKILDQLMSSDRAEFLAIYGRRRVGKTYLIYEYLKSNIVFSFSGSFNQPTKIQLGNFFREYIRITKGQKQTNAPTNWDDAFSYLTDFLYELQVDHKKIVVFIDEMPWLDVAKSKFVPALEYFWNQHGSKMNHLVLIACGSAASWIRKKLLKSKGGLYNRVTRRIKLEPFNLHQTKLWCQQKNLKLSTYQIIQLYMVLGGIPFYWNELRSGKSVAQHIHDLCFEPTGLLYDEYEQLYYSLFKKAANHIAIVETLSNHPYGMTRNELVKQAGLKDSGSISRAIEDLVESGFIFKYRPFQKKQKDSIYRLVDLYTLFYLKFIKENNNTPSNSWQMLMNDQKFIIWSGYAYENICLLHTKQILKKLGISGTITQISSWYHKGNKEIPGAQIDLLIDRKDGLIHLCEAKFSNTEYIISKDYAAKLRKKRAIFEKVTKTKKSIVTTLISTYPAIQNTYYQEEIFSEVVMEDLFSDVF